MIDIIIPIYNSRKTLPNTLFSIIMQDAKDKIKVCLVDDASTEKYNDILEKFKDSLRIKYIRLKENKGPGVAREIGISRTNSKYIMFLDSDDLLHDTFSITNVLEQISDEYDLFISKTEVEEENNSYYFGCLHGSIISRKFIEEHNIHFSKNRCHEDNFFMQTLEAFSPRKLFFDSILDIYRKRENSITNEYDDYHLRTIDKFVSCLDETVKFLEKNNCNLDNILYIVYKNFGVLYYNYNVFINNKYDVKEYLNKCNKALDLYYKYYDKINDVYRTKYLYETYNYMIDNNYNIQNQVSLDSFINSIKEEKEKPLNNKDMVFALSCNENWYKYLVVDIYSLIKSNKNTKKIYLIVETENIDKIPYLRYLSDTYKVEFKLINFNKIKSKYISDTCPNVDTPYTAFAFGKLILPDIVKEEKVIYLDTDALVIKDLSRLWDIDITDYYAAGCRDQGVMNQEDYFKSLDIPGKYINSGVILYNIPKCREENIIEKEFELLNNKELKYPDQDAFNKVCNKHIHYISTIYNYSLFITQEIINREYVKIYHFAGPKTEWLVDNFNSETWYGVEEEFHNELIKNNVKK